MSMNAPYSTPTVDTQYGMGVSTDLTPTDQLKTLMSIFGPSKAYNADPQMFEPITSMTLSRALEPESEYMADTFITNFLKREGWWTFLAPPVRQENLSMRWRTYIANNSTLDAAPERTAAKYVNYRVENHYETMTRWSKGTEAIGDWFKTENGKKEVLFKISIITNAAYTTYKINVTYAVINNKMHWKEIQYKLGSAYGNLNEVFRQEYDVTFAMNKDWKFVQKIQALLDKILPYSNGFQPNMWVVTEGSLNYLRLMNDKMTKASQVGTELAVRNLNTGSSVIESMVPGVRIFEDMTLKNLENIGPDEMELLQSVALIGEYVIADAGNYIPQRHHNSKALYNHLGYQFVDAGINNWQTMTITNLIKNSGRWTSTGELHPDHFDLLKDLQVELNNSKVGIANKTLGPYFWNSDAATIDSGSGLTSSGSWRVIEDWGDMDPKYWPFELAVEHGEDAANYIMTKIDPQDLQNIRELRKAQKRMGEITNISADLQAYFFAIAALNANDTSSLLTRNMNGGVMPPSVDVNGNLYFEASPRHYVQITNRNAKDGAFEFVTVPEEKYDPQAPENAKAPSVPIGFGSETGKQTLAQMYREGDTRGWNVDFLRTIYNGVESENNVYAIMKSLYPRCELMDPSLLPYDQVSGDVETDSKNAFFINTNGTFSPAIWIKGVSKSNKEFTSEIQGMGRTGTTTKTFTSFADNIFGVDTNDSNTLKNILNASINDMNPTLLQVISSSNGDLLKDTFAQNKNLGPSLIESTGNKGDDTLSGFIKNHVLNAPKNVNQSNILTGVLGLVYTAYQKGKLSTPLKESMITSLGKSALKKRKREDIVAPPDDSSIWVNSGLTLSNTLWKNWARQARLKNPGVARFINSNIRPSHPTASGVPLTTEDNDDKLIYFEQAKTEFTADGSNQHIPTVYGNWQHSSAYVGESVQQQKKQQFAPSSAALPNLRNYANERQRYTDDLMETEEMYESAFDSEYDTTNVSNNTYPGATTSFTSPFVGSPQGGADNKFVEKTWLKLRFDYVVTQLAANPIARMAAIALLLSEVHRDSLLALAKVGIHGAPDSTFIHARPWIRIRADAMIIAQGGSSTARLGYNFEDVSRGYNSTNKVWSWHYTIWMNCAILNPRFIMVIPHVRARGYIGGMGDSLYTSPSQFNPNRLSYERDGFIFSTGCAFGKTTAKKVADPLSLMGKFDKRFIPHELREDVDTRVFNSSMPQWPSFHYYNYRYKFDQINRNTAMPDLLLFAAMRRSPPFHGMMSYGNQKTWDNVKQQYVNTPEGQGTGHLADFKTPGISKYLDGETQFEVNRYD